jgi:peptide/nickel transport system permease protein
VKRRIDNTRGVLLALAGLTLLCLLLPGLPTQNPLHVMVDQRLTPPDAAHWLGTDELGRDMLSRVVSGTALTVGVSVAALLSSLAIGIVLGALAGRYYGRWPDYLFLWLADLLTAVPFLIVIAAVLSVTGPGLAKAYAVLTGIIWVSPARIVRAEILKTLPLEYVAADRALGSPEWRIMLVTVIPATVGSAITFSIGYLPEIIALEAGLSFLGLGVQPPQPSLGKMIFDGLTYIGAAWWMAVVPAGALFLIVTGVQAIAWYARRERGAH